MPERGQGSVFSGAAVLCGWDALNRLDSAFQAAPCAPPPPLLECRCEGFPQHLI